MKHIDPRVSFGRRVRALRESKDLSQEALADLCDLHRTYVGSVERGERNVGLLNIVRIAKALSTTCSDLMRDVK